MRDGVGSSVERRDDVLLCQIVCIDFKNRQQRHDHVSHVALETQVPRRHFFPEEKRLESCNQLVHGLLVDWF